MLRGLKFLFKLGLLAGVLVSFAVAGVFFYYAKDLPDYRQLAEYQPATMTRLYADDGTLAAEYAREKRLFVPLSSIPMVVRNAFVAAEDRNFYTHPGIDARGILRAFLHNLRAQENMQGASTITQQVAKNMLLSQERTFSRKIREVLLAVRISRAYSKERVLELYLNEIYLGAGAYGVTAAALAYFNKPLTDLTIEEAALLAAMPKAPTAFNPWKNEKRAFDRRNWILSAMAEERFITWQEATEAAAKPMALHKYEPPVAAKAEFFTEEVRRRLAQEYGEDALYGGGLTVHTTLDLHLQKLAEQALRDGLVEYTARTCPACTAPQANGALVAMDVHTGRVLALAGGYSAEQSEFNRATQAKRQPGSAFKPFVYLAALEQGYTPASRLREQQLELPMASGEHAPIWSPENYSGEYHGLTTLRTGIEKSLNVLTVALAQEVGLEKIIASVEKFHLAPNYPHELGMALGTTETDLLSLTNAYAVLANGGRDVTPVLVDSIEDRHGNVIYKDTHYRCTACDSTDEAVPPEVFEDRRQLVDPRLDYQVVSMLQGVVERGTGVAAKALNRPVAGKTGTTNDSRDAWFIGFTPDIAVGVYVGYDTPQSLGAKEQGATVALPIFIRFMAAALEGIPPKDFAIPEGVTRVEVDARTGYLPTKETPKTERITEVFLTGTEPKIGVPREVPPPPPPAVPASMQYHPAAADEEPKSLRRSMNRMR